MKRHVVTLFCLFVCFALCFAQKEKVVEQSAKKVPEWIGTSNADYFSVSATAETLDKAQSQCLNDIRQHIISTIAVNITASESLSQTMFSTNEVAGVLTQYSSQVDTRSAQLPFLSGISLSNAKEVYWERRFVKGDKRYYYVYHVYYPFSEYQRTNAIAQFKKMDAEYENKLIELEKNYREFTNLDYVREAVAEIKGLMGYFFDSARATRAAALYKAYRDCLADVVVEEGVHSTNKINYTLSLHGRTVTTSRKPTFRSNYADNIKVSANADVNTIQFEPVSIPGEEHTIEMKYLLDGRTLSHKFLFDPYQGRCVISIASAVEMASIGDTLIRVRIELKSESQTAFSVEKAQLSIDNTNLMFFYNDLDNNFAGKGVHTLILYFNQNRKNIKDSGVISGVLNLAMDGHNGFEVYEFKVPYKIN